MDNLKSLTDDETQQLGFLTDLTQQISGGTVKLVKEGDQLQVKYLDSDKSYVDSSQCGKIVAPKSNPKKAIENCLYLYETIKEKGLSDGVNLDTAKISKNFKSTYEEGKDYEILNRILGKGLNDEIVVVRDKKLGSEHALKTMMIANFREDEIRCWTDLEGYDNFPTLYMFTRKNGRIHLHCEILDNAVTITDIIDNRMKKLRGNQKLLRHFSLYVLQGLLEASSIMHSKNWLHDDLHEGNAMIQQTPNDDVELKVRVLDFGRAKVLDKQKTITKDIQEIIRVFTSVYVTEGFKNAMDLKTNWKDSLKAQADLYQLSEDDKVELLSLIEIALNVHHIEEEMELKEEVERRLRNSSMDNPGIMQTIYDLLFPGNDLAIDCVDGVSPVSFTFKNILKIEGRYQE